MLNSNMSIGANLYVSNLFIIWTDWGIIACGRYYPGGDKFFAELGLGYSYHSGIGDFTVTYGGTTYKGNDWIGTTGFGIVPGLGWKIDVGEPGGFFVQPGIKLPITLGKQKPIISGLNQYDGEFGVGIGLVLYCGFGYAF